MADVHRKIELQSQDDLRYLINNVRHAAAHRMDEALPPNAARKEDEFRQRVEELVYQYITETFNTAAPNISINGHAPPPALLDALLSPASQSDVLQIEEFEPLNTKQHARAAELARAEEELLVDIAALRRDAPVKAKELWSAALVEGAKGEELRHDDKVADVDLGITELQRQKAVESAWSKGVEGLERLKRELPGTVARMERAKAAGEYVLTER